MVRRAGQRPFRLSNRPRRNYIYSLQGSAIRSKHSEVDKETWVGLETANTNYFALTYADTTEYCRFNSDEIRKPYGIFKERLGPETNTRQTSYIVRLEEPVELLESYYENLKVKTADSDNELTLSVLSGNQQKGADFLNKLLQIYGGQYPIFGHEHESPENAMLWNKKFTMLEKPENNVVYASISTFWIYTIALICGFLIVAWVRIVQDPRKYVLHPGLLTLPRLFDRIYGRFAVKQID